MLLLAAGKSEYYCRDFFKIEKFKKKEPKLGSSVYVSASVLIIFHFWLKTHFSSVKFSLDFKRIFERRVMKSHVR